MKTFVKISGVVYLSVFISGFYANFAILENLINGANNSETTLNIIHNSTQLKQGLVGFLVMLILDIVLIWSLFEITKPTHKNLSYTAALFRGFHALFFAIALVKLGKVYSLTAQVTNSVDLQHRVIELITEFDELWTMGLLFFCIHLLVLGILSLKSDYIPSVFGFLLILAGFGYFIDSFSKLFFVSYIAYQSYFEALVIVTGVIGELSFTVWLLVQGFTRQNFSL